MMILINMGRIALAIWVGYSLVLILAPSWVHHVPDLKGGIIQFLAAYGLGFLLDRLLAVFRRRKAARAASVAAAMAPDPVSAPEGSGVI